MERLFFFYYGGVVGVHCLLLLTASQGAYDLKKKFITVIMISLFWPAMIGLVLWFIILSAIRDLIDWWRS